MSIRIATLADIREVRDLFLSLAHYYLNELSADLPEWFAKTLSVQSFSERFGDSGFKNYVFEEENQIVGYVALKNDGHLYHLFVSEQFQGKGIGRQLWQYAKGRCPSSRFSVRSSIFAVPVYKQFGFLEFDGVGTKDGISFQAMELGHEC
jgi:GNAT superfamily N-acetyltransferase